MGQFGRLPTYAYGPQNKFTPVPGIRGQGTKFTDGQVISVDAQNGDEWHFAGSTETISGCQ